jgi:hypothetical protein
MNNSMSLSVVTALVASVTANAFPATVAATENCAPLVQISFLEGAPVDRFIIKNSSEEFEISAMEINLASSRGRLIFDTINGGAGVEVFQPYKTVAGSARLAQAVSVSDGSENVGVRFESFPAGADYTFSIDVDDRLTASELGQIRVSGSEMEGAQASFDLVGKKGVAKRVTTSFGKDNEANVRNTACSS